MIERTLRGRPRLALLASAILTAVGLWYVVGPMLFSPNQYIYSFGGDALVLYYNAAYHITHGEPGQTLDAMLYPHGELIYLTDAQGFVVVCLQWVHRHLIDLSDHVVGIVHTLNNLGVILAGPLVYLVAVRLGVWRFMALLFAPSIVLLSPQILRLGGHFGLAYAYVIPLTILWFLRKRTRFDYKDLVVALVLLAATFNNPYVGFSAGLALLAAVAIGLLRRRDRGSLTVTGIAMAAVLAIPFLYFKVFDPFDDRIKLQWGALVFRTRLLGGSLTPDGSLLRRWVASKSSAEWESYQYLGVVPLISIILWLLLRLGNEYHAVRLSLKRVPATAWSYLGGATLAYLFVYDWGFGESTSRWIEEKASFLLMFKAIARLGWPFYFAVGVSGMILLQQVIAVRTWRLAWVPMALTVAFATLYAYDVQVYHRGRYPEHFDNLFRTARLDAKRAELASIGIAPGDYQALLLVPRSLSWNDNVLVDWDWASHLAGVNASMALGLPMVNANLSRASVGALQAVTQLMSRPGIDRRAFLDQLPDARPILLVKTTQPWAFTPGEEYLLSLADSIGSLDQVTLLRLDPTRLRQAEGEGLRARCSAFPDARTPLLHLDYNAELTADAYAGGGAHALAVGGEEVLNYVARDSTQLVVLSAWIRSTDKRYGLGNLHVLVRDRGDGLVEQTRIDTRQLGDASGMWLYFERAYELRPGHRLNFWMNAELGNTYLDEVMVRLDGSPTVARSGDDTLYGGIKIDCGN